MSTVHTAHIANDMAFPVLDRDQTPNGTHQLGLTKRELFAAMAMQGMLASGSISRADVASRSVAFAAALIEALSDETRTDANQT